IHADAVRPVFAVDQHQQRHGQRQHAQRAGEVDAELERMARLVEGNQQSAGHQRQQDWQDDEVLGPVYGAHESDSSPSTWSVPVRPSAPIIITRYRAVVAKPMTRAVSTSACGSGSAIWVGSKPGSSVTGGLSSHSRPITKMNRLTP